MKQSIFIGVMYKLRPYLTLNFASFFLILSFLSMPFEGLASVERTLLEGDTVEEKAEFVLGTYGEVDSAISQIPFSRCAVNKVLSDSLFTSFFTDVEPVLRAHNALLEVLILLKGVNGDNPIQYPRGWSALDLEDCGKGVTVCHEKLRWGQLQKLLDRLEERVPVLQSQLAAAQLYHMEVKRAGVVTSFDGVVAELEVLSKAFNRLSDVNPHSDADLDIPDMEDDITEIELQIVKLKKRRSDLNALLEKAQSWESVRSRVLASYAKHQQDMLATRSALEEYLSDKDYNVHNGFSIDELEDPADADEQEEMESITASNESLVAALKGELKKAKVWQKKHDFSKKKLVRVIAQIEKARSIFEAYMATAPVRESANPINLDDVSDAADGHDEHDLEALERIIEENKEIVVTLKGKLTEAKVWQREHKAAHAVIAKNAKAIAKARTSFETYMSTEPSENDTTLDGIDDPRDASDVHDLAELAEIQEEGTDVLKAIQDKLAEAEAWTAS